MAKLIETKIVIKFSTIVANSSDKDTVLSDEQIDMLSKSIPELAETIVNSEAIIVEMDLE